MAYRSKADGAYLELRQRILKGELAPGAVVNQEQLASDLGVSTTPLREALRRLESEGFVSMPAHRDVIVAELSPDELVSLYDVRLPLDALAAKLAAHNHDEQDRERITGSLTHDPVDDERDAVDRNRRFHRSIYLASHNDVLIGVLDGLWDRSDRYRRLTGGIPAFGLVTPSHEELAELVLAGRDRAAEAAMRAHVRAARDIIQRRVRADAGLSVIG